MADEFSTELVKRFTGEIASRLGDPLTCTSSSGSEVTFPLAKRCSSFALGGTHSPWLEMSNGHSEPANFQRREK